LFFVVAISLAPSRTLAAEADPGDKAQDSSAVPAASSDQSQGKAGPSADKPTGKNPEERLDHQDEGGGDSGWLWNALTQLLSDWFSAQWNALTQFLSGLKDFLTDNNWPLILLAFLILYRERLSQLLASLERRGLSVGVPPFTLTLNEVATEPPLPSVAFAPSPLALEPPVSEETAAGAVLSDLKPQLEFTVSGTVARVWRTTAKGKPLADRMTETWNLLEKGCREGCADLSERLLAFCRALEASRYLEAGKLLDLSNRCPPLHDLLDARKAATPATVEDRLILCCLGTALAQQEQWKEAFKVLTPLDPTKGPSPYLPAADIYLVALYNREIAQTIESDEDWPDLQSLQTKIVPHVEPLAKAIDDAYWPSFGIAPCNAPYYRREFHCTVGSILSLIAELSGADREPLLTQAEKYLLKCTETIEGEPPTSRDYNNLADLYRQLKRFDEGLAEFEKARSEEPPNPILYDTRAQIFNDSGRYLESLLAIQEYTRAHAAKAPADYLAQYIRNQMLHAKLRYRMIERTGTGEIDSVVQILDGAREFLESRRGTFPAEEYPDLRGKVVEMLGYAYLAKGDVVEKAESLFQSLETATEANRKSERRWRRQIALARGHVASSRSERKQLSPQRALRHLKSAKQILQATPQWRADYPIDDGKVSQWRRSRRLRSHLDAMAANVALAEECLQVGETSEAQTLAEEPISDLVHDVRTNLDDPKLQGALASDLATVRTTLVRLEALQNFILGRALLRTNPLATDLASFDRALFCLDHARSLDPDLAALGNIEAGFALVNAAFHGQGPLVRWYDRGVADLEGAVQRGDTTIRAEALRVLACVYGQRAAVERLQSQSGVK